MPSEDAEAIVRIDHPAFAGITTIRFNRPHVRNALRPEDLLATSKHLFDCQYDSRIKAVFLTGAGSSFCAGFDLKLLNSLSPMARAGVLDTATELMMRIVSMPKIVIVAMNGASAGLGNHIALCSDLCIAQAGSALHFTGVAKGIPSMQLGALLLPSVIGLKRAKSLLLRGGQLSAEDACEMGICNEVAAPDDWNDVIDNLARDFSERDIQTLALNKFQLNQQAFQMLGALKLSALAGASYMAAAEKFSTGRLTNQPSR